MFAEEQSGLGSNRLTHGVADPGAPVEELTK